MSPLILSLLKEFSYFGIFILLAGGAIFIPIPEEITLLTIGYFLAIGLLSLPLTLLVSIVGLLFGDAVLFYLAKVGGTMAHTFRARINKIGLEHTWLFSPKQPLRSVLLRFLTGFRFIAPIYSGFEGASWLWFLVLDTLVILVFVPIMLWLGFYFHASIVVFIASFELVRHAIFILVLAAAGAGMLPVLYRALYRKQRKN